MKFGKKCINLFSRYSRFVYYGYQEKLNKEKTKMAAEVGKPKEGIINELGKMDVDAAMKAANGKIDDIAKKYTAWVDNEYKSEWGKHTGKQIAIKGYKNSIKSMADKAKESIYAARNEFNKKKEAEVAFAKFNVDRMDLEHEHNGLLKLVKNPYVNAELPETEDVAAKEENLKLVFGNLSNLSTIYKQSTDYLSKVAGTKADLLEAAKKASPKLLTKITTAIIRIERGVDDFNSHMSTLTNAYNEGLKKLDKNLPIIAAKEKKKISKYKNASGVANEKMKSGKMTQDERMEAYNKWQAQIKFVKKLDGAVAKVKGLPSLDYGDFNM